jgi:hypothetical protein
VLRAVGFCRDDIADFCEQALEASKAIMHPLTLLSLGRPIKEQAVMFHGILMVRSGRGRNECGSDLKWLLIEPPWDDYFGVSGMAMDWQQALRKRRFFSTTGW